MSDIPGDLSTTATFAVGGTATDNLETVGDHDWFKVTLTAGQAVTVTVNGLTLVDPYLNIRDASGNIIYSNDDIIDGVNRNSKVSFNPPSTGTYYIDVGSWDDKFTGTYQVSVQPYVQPPLATNDQIAAQLVSGFWGGDVHHFNVTQGGTITVNISTLKPSEQTLARAALQEWTDIIGVHFQEVTTGGQIVFDDSEDSSGPDRGDRLELLRRDHDIVACPHLEFVGERLRDRAQHLQLSDLYSRDRPRARARARRQLQRYGDVPIRRARSRTTPGRHRSCPISTRGRTATSTGWDLRGRLAVTPMPADILAMQQLYGLSTTTRTGDTTYGYHSNAGGIYDTTPGPGRGLHDLRRWRQ